MRLQWLLRPDDFNWLADAVGLAEGTRERQVLQLRCLQGRSDAEIATELQVTLSEVQAALTTALQAWQSQQSGSVQQYRELLDVMRGARPHSPSPPLVGFDKHYPGDPAHAHEVAVRAKVLTAEDLAYGEQRWRGVSLIEEAQRGKAERRRKRQRKGKKG